MNPRTGGRGGREREGQNERRRREAARTEKRLTRLGSALGLVHRHEAGDDSNTETSDDSTSNEGSEGGGELKSDSDGEDGGSRHQTESSTDSISDGL